MTEKEQRILEMQAPSTRKCLERSPDLDLAWLRREIPKEAQVVKEDGSVDLNIRQFTKEEAEWYNPDTGGSSIYGRNRKRGARFEAARASHLNSAKIHDKLKEQIETPHVMPSPEKRDVAVEAFMKSRTVEAVKNAFKAIFETVTSAETVIAQRWADTRKRWKNEE